MYELRAINEAFLDAFTIDSLERLVKFELGIGLDSVVSGDDFTNTVFRLTSWASREGKLDSLIEAAKKETENEYIQSLRKAPQRRELSSNKVDGELVTSLDLLEYKVQHLIDEVDKLQRIVMGPDGTNGIRSLSLENKRTLGEISQTVQRLELVLSDRQQTLVDPRTKAAFGLIIVLLSATFLIVAASAFGWL